MRARTQIRVRISALRMLFGGFHARSPRFRSLDLGSEGVLPITEQAVLGGELVDVGAGLARDRFRRPGIPFSDGSPTWTSRQLSKTTAC
jgi:hypothetical protein